ncbi:MAG TPA: hypothetical protein DCZ94_08825 [Lentisphaeria bacterium]|nr:MAG: hypothetical protein A2X48_23575 [Lentisphaerae bacterium GWF2_49_21]HBC87043.1 hypothetical protein [Lentisphaeria bacterium]
MLKLNASYQKKVPAEQEYSSKCFHASIEIELPDGLSEDQLKQRIHSTFELVKSSVETELNGKTAAAVTPAQPTQANGNGKNANMPATKKQVSYLLDIAKEKAVDITPYLRRCNAGSAYDLTREQCSQLIDQIK